VKLGKESGLV